MSVLHPVSGGPRAPRASHGPQASCGTALPSGRLVSGSWAGPGGGVGRVGTLHAFSASVFPTGGGGTVHASVMKGPRSISWRQKGCPVRSAVGVSVTFPPVLPEPPPQLGTPPHFQKATFLLSRRVGLPSSPA